MGNWSVELKSGVCHCMCGQESYVNFNGKKGNGYKYLSKGIKTPAEQEIVPHPICLMKQYFTRNEILFDEIVFVCEIVFHKK